MKLEIDIPEHQYNNIIAFSSINLGRVPYKGIIMYAINAIKNATPIDQDPNVRHCFGCKYSKDNHRAGTEKCHLCMWENQYTPATKNDLGVDLISRADVNRLICEYRDDATETGNERDLERAYGANAVGELISELPSVTPQLSSELAKNSKKLEKDFGELDCISRAEVLKAMDTWDKFGNDPNEGLIPLRTPALQDRYVPYVKYDDMVNCVKGMSSVTPIRPKGHWIVEKGGSYLGKRNGYCSNCKDFYTNDWNVMNYCPNCGADMREVE